MGSPIESSKLTRRGVLISAVGSASLVGGMNRWAEAEAKVPQSAVGFVRATAGRLRWAQHAQTQAAIRPRGRSTRPTRRSAFVCKPGG